LQKFDPIDRVYAFLGLAVRMEVHIDVKPDYTKTTSEIYQDFLLKYVDCVQYITTLSQCELRESIKYMPSWVPEWSLPSESKNEYNKFRASGYSAGKIHYSDPGILKPIGVGCATIQKVEDSTYNGHDIIDVMAIVQRLCWNCSCRGHTSWLHNGFILRVLFTGSLYG
jgi:hypothetical protein